MSEDHFGFMAYVDRGSAQDLPDLLDKGFQDASFVIERHVVHRPGEFARTYSHSSGWRLNCAGADGQSDSRPGWQGWPAWALLPIAHSQVVALPGNVLIDAIRVACMMSNTVIGRSFHPSGQTMLDLSELDGTVDMLDWLQYFGPQVTARVGAERISRAGFFAAEALSNGGYLVRTRETYLDEWPVDGRRTLVDALGIVPRVLRYKATADRWAEMRWC